MIFLDNASTTKPSKDCINISGFYQTERFFNPSAPYHPSVVAAEDLSHFRDTIIKKLKGNGKIVFTSSGTESDNFALFCSKKRNGSRIIVSQSEHPAVATCANELKNRGFDVVFCPVDASGRVIEEEFLQLLSKDVSLVSIMHVNNETGAQNDVKRLCALTKNFDSNILFHSDGVQALGKVPVALDDLGVDFYSMSAHKIHGLRGVGALFIKNGLHLRTFLYGGGQEFNVRSSTENLAGIAAFSCAVDYAINHQKENYEKVKDLNGYLRTALSEQGDAYKIISDPGGSPYILNFAMRYVRGEVMVHSLEKYEIFVGTGSACSSKKTDRTVAKFANLSPEYEKGVLRVSFDENTSKDDVDYFINKLNLEYLAIEKYMRG
ncbi:MAG: cysteine desulfurase [Clostridia bacterium]|nr:cysteine desulfurase [Clostridia bacterium]